VPEALFDRVLDTTTTTGTGTVTLSGSPPLTYQAISVVTDSDTVPYVIAHQTVNEWETGIGTKSGSTLARTEVRSSSNSGNAVNFSAGTKTVFVEQHAAQLTMTLGTDGRLTLTSATPVISTGVTAATTVYYTPYVGDRITLPKLAGWVRRVFTEQSIKLTDTQTGTTSNGTATITGLSNTSQFVRGMKVTGTNVGTNAVINSIDSATQVTVSVNSTGNGTNSLTFKCPAGKNYDIIGVDVSSALKLRFSNAWTNDTTRADAITTQNGLDVNNAAINSADSNTIAAKQGLILGTVRTTGTDGQTECAYRKDSTAGATTKWYLWNRLNRAKFGISVYDSTDSWTYTTATLRSKNNSTNNRVELVLGAADADVAATVQSSSSNPSDVSAPPGIGLDSTSATSAFQTTGGAAGSGGRTGLAVYFGRPGLGYHFIQELEISAAAGTTTWYGDNGNSALTQSGMTVELWA
jgi:hypothetical protein